MRRSRWKTFTVIVYRYSYRVVFLSCTTSSMMEMIGEVDPALCGTRARIGGQVECGGSGGSSCTTRAQNALVDCDASAAESSSSASGVPRKYIKSCTGHPNSSSAPENSPSPPNSGRRLKCERTGEGGGTAVGNKAKRTGPSARPCCAYVECSGPQLPY